MENFPILLIIALCIAIYRLYTIRDQFKNLNKSEWIRYIIGFVLAFAVACTIIMGGIYILKLLLTGFLYIIGSVILVCLGLVVAQYVFRRFIPMALKSYYDK